MGWLKSLESPKICEIRTKNLDLAIVNSKIELFRISYSFCILPKFLVSNSKNIFENFKNFEPTKYLYYYPFE